MRIEQLQYFLEAVRCASINKASQKLHITQQSMNTALKKLEDELGVKLLERSHSGITLTASGEMVLLYAKDILSRYEEMKKVLEADKDLEDNLYGRLILATAPIVSHLFLPKVMEQFMGEHNKVVMQVIEKENREMIQDILNEKECLCFLCLTKKSDKAFALLDLSRVYYRSVGHFSLYASVGLNHPLAKQKSVTLKSILKYPLAIYRASDQVQNFMVDMLFEAGKPNIQLETNNIQLYREIISSNQVVGFTPKADNTAAFQNRYIPIVDMPAVEGVCIATKEYYKSSRRLIEAFLDYFIQQ